MRLSSTFVFFGLVIAGALAYPMYDESTSLYARSADAEDLALRDLYEAYLDEITTRDYDDAADLEARHEHLHFGSGEGPSVTVRLRSDEFDELEARNYDDLPELEARHHGPSITIHLRDDMELEELVARYDELLGEREFDYEDFEAREDDEQLDAREPFHPRIGTVILSPDN